ncbi:MAG TPA: enoyl-CoA hydratase-related protein [Pseudoduganella sp.]|jgi:enoyl-CoA hydratase
MPLVEARVDVAMREGVVSLTLNDPARGNVLSRALCGQLTAAVRAANDDSAARLILIRAHGRAFCAGADLQDLKAAAGGDTAAVQAVYDAFMAVADSPLPTVALVQGPAVGAGMNLALACDVRFVTGDARFDTRFLQIGLHPGGGHAWMLQRAVGWQQAARLLLLGQVADAAEALRLGLAAARIDDEAGLLDACAKAAAAPRELLLRTKRSMRLAVGGQTHDEAYRHETGQQLWSLQQDAFTALVERLQRQLAAGKEAR